MRVIAVQENDDVVRIQAGPRNLIRRAECGNAREACLSVAWLAFVNHLSPSCAGNRTGVIRRSIIDNDQAREVFAWNFGEYER